jgi:nucleoside-diphosphate-sugar epimerase
VLKANGRRSLDPPIKRSLNSSIRKSIFLNVSLGNYGKWKKAGEDYIKQSGLDYVIVRPGKTYLEYSDRSFSTKTLPDSRHVNE